MIINSIINNRSHRIIILLIVILYLIGFKAVTVEGAGLRVSPLYIQKEVKDGEILGPVVITNNSPMDFKVRIFAVTAEHDLEGTVVIKEENKTDMLILENTDFTLKKGGQKEIYPRVNLKGIETGGIYPVLVIDALPVSENGTNVSASFRFSVLTLLTVKDPGESRGQISEVKVEQPDKGEPLTFKVLVENNSKIHRKPVGSVLVYSEGDVIDKIPLKPENILPGNMRWIKGLWKPSDLPPGSYTYKGELYLGNYKLNIPSGKFGIHEPYTLTRRNLELTRVGIPLASVKEGINYRLLVSNEGNIEDTFKGEIRIVSKKNGNTLINKRVSVPEIKPGSSSLVEDSLDASDLKTGQYVFQVVNNFNKIMESREFELLLEKPVVKLAISKFSIPNFKEGKPVKATVVFTNEGNTLLELQGMLEFKDLDGNRVGFLPLKGLKVEPGQSLEKVYTWQGGIPAGLYEGIITVIYGDKSLRKNTSFMIQP
ncbi:hypothetical protein Hore_20430 [Halothermothrix orenii H 168]|uniref:Uncharacterized protein n=2 Tax=Halothermothrix orenii TaxID=31909 RepID=B8CZT6_HALOH|nr:hypothetical protein Hore_20430 [Halothermothrix orenii H 168]